MADVIDAAMMMGTAPNQAILADAGLLGDQGRRAGGGDLIIAVRAKTAAAAKAAMLAAEAQLQQPRAGGGEARRGPRRPGPT